MADSQPAGQLSDAEGEEVVRAAATIDRWCSMEDEQTAVGPEGPDEPADLFVLFGGGVLGIVDTLAEAMDKNLAARYAIVGGRGHATFWLERSMGDPLYQGELEAARVDPAVASESEMLAVALTQEYGQRVDFLETRSTNCGNNITYLLDLLDAQSLRPTSVILSQDPTMQRRMHATWSRQAEDRQRFASTRLLSLPAFRASLTWHDGDFAWDDAPRGMWKPERYLQLLAGEVDRMTDNESGYGPNGADYIAHVDVPPEVTQAAESLKALCPHVTSPRQ